VFALYFLRFKYGPPIIVVVGVALLSIGAGVTHHLVTGIIGAALVILGTAAGITRKRRAGLLRGRDENHRAMSRSKGSTDDVPVAATRRDR
jgi:hypothetical protein